MSDGSELRNEDGDFFPWEDVEASRNNRLLQGEHPLAEARQSYGSFANPCPKCQATADKLSWFYFESPAETWESLCGRAGWMTVCDRCHAQVEYFGEAMN